MTPDLSEPGPGSADTLADAAIDYAALYRAQMRCRGLIPKPAGAWDARAASYGRNSGRSGYVDDFIGRVDLAGARSLLDVGCGPGTLALPLAARLDEVIALDYSARMLDELQLRAAEQGVTNVRAVLRAWEDDWSDLPVCDIAIASRSTVVDDLEAALDKLDRHARLRAYLTYPVGGHLLDPEVLALTGAQVATTPDYLLLLGMLRARGAFPRVDYILAPNRLAGSAGFDEFAQRLSWFIGDLEPAARERLRHWYAQDPQRAFTGGAPTRWVFIGWEPPAAGAGRT